MCEPLLIENLSNSNHICAKSLENKYKNITLILIQFVSSFSRSLSLSSLCVCMCAQVKWIYMVHNSIEINGKFNWLELLYVDMVLLCRKLVFQLVHTEKWYSLFKRQLTIQSFIQSQCKHFTKLKCKIWI